MSTKTKKIFIVALGMALVSLIGLGYFFYVIHVEGIRLEEQQNILSENNSKESAYIRLKRLAEETKDERVLLEASFFKQEGDSIIFLGEVESLAASLGLKLKTEALDKIVDTKTKKETIKITFLYEGQKAVVEKFSKLIEVTPYHSRVESLALRKLTDGNWEGRLTINITINTL